MPLAASLARFALLPAGTPSPFSAKRNTMADSKGACTLRTRKMMKNPLLARRQMVSEACNENVAAARGEESLRRRLWKAAGSGGGGDRRGTGSAPRSRLTTLPSLCGARTCPPSRPPALPYPSLLLVWRPGRADGQPPPHQGAAHGGERPLTPGPPPLTPLLSPPSFLS